MKTTPIRSALFCLITLIVAVLCVNIRTISAQEQSTLNRAVLLDKRVELPSKSIAAKIIRVTFSPAFKTPQHAHQGPGPRYVVKGKLKVIEGGKVNIYSAGEVFWESGLLMSVENMV